jgi:hypothetical protein
MVAPSILKLSVLLVVGVCIFSSWSSASPTAKRNMGMDTNGFYGDTFDNGFGSFETVKRAHPQSKLLYRVVADKRIPRYQKRFSDGGMNGFHGDTFSSGFGDFSTQKKRFDSGNNGFFGDTFNDGFGDFSTAKRKKSMGMNSFHGDTFSHGFGDFETV